MSYEFARSQAQDKMAEHLRQIAQALQTMTDILADEVDHQRQAIDPDSLGAVALWREAVARDGILLGFSEWMAWRNETADPPLPVEEGQS